jgi:uncharacterized membrane protein
MILAFIGLIMLIMSFVVIYALELQKETAWNIASTLFVIGLPFFLYGKFPKRDKKQS